VARPRGLDQTFGQILYHRTEDRRQKRGSPKQTIRMGFGEPNLGQVRGVAGWVAEAIARVEHPSRERQRRPARVSSRDGLRAARLEDRDHCLRDSTPIRTQKFELCMKKFFNSAFRPAASDDWQIQADRSDVDDSHTARENSPRSKNEAGDGAQPRIFGTRNETRWGDCVEPAAICRVQPGSGNLWPHQEF
jgi:hypothetical protein